MYVMENENLILCLDFDDVILNTKSIVEPLLEKICYFSSESFFKSTFCKDEEERNKLQKKHFDYKDRVLEEVDDEFKERIDYNSVIKKENAFPGAIQNITNLYNSNLFREIYIVTHCNTEREINAKINFINKYLPFAKPMFVKFHEIDYNYAKENGIRRMASSKAENVKNRLGIDDISNFLLVDDSKTNGKDWVKNNGIFALYKHDCDQNKFNYEEHCITGRYTDIIPDLSIESISNAIVAYLNNGKLDEYNLEGKTK